MKTESGVPAPLPPVAAAAQRPRGISLSSAPLYSSLVVILALGILISTMLTINEQQAFKEHLTNIQKNFNEQYRGRVREELEKSIAYIEQQRSQADEQVEYELRRKVQSAYTIASHFYRMYRDELSPSELRSMVTEVLRPIRWSNDHGYYIAGRIRDRVFDLVADEPALEGQPLDILRDDRETRVADAMIAQVRDKGAGLLLYDMVPPGTHDPPIPKIAFVKDFEPFDWFIGAEVSRQDVEKILRETLLERMRQMRFGNDGHIFVFRRNGTIISHRDERLVGRSIQGLTDAAGKDYGAQLLTIGTDKSGGDYVEFAGDSSGNSTRRNKLVFVRAYRDWDWVLCACMSMDEMERAISDQTAIYRKIATKNVSLFFFLFALAMVLLLASSFIYSLKIKKGINLFTDFFRRAVDEKVKIRKAEMTFAEFVALGSLANRMIDDLVLHEDLQRRDEVRLDTLLHLGSMPAQPVHDRFGFILQRLARITSSPGGYLALVDEEQTHLTICAFLWHGNPGAGPLPDDSRPAVSLDDAGLPGALVGKPQGVIHYMFPGDAPSSRWPYPAPVTRCIDVPLHSDDRTVMIAGVCDSDRPYDTADARQITLLLEGLWLHVVKARAEEETARLERQIIAVSEQERSSIGRDLHDDLGSHLSGVELLSKALQKKLEQEAPQHAGQLGTIRDLIRDAIDKTRRLAHGLYPVHIIQQGLEASVEELTAEIENLFHLDCSCSFEGPLEWADDNTAPQVYSIIREAAFNAARHGEPRGISIVVRAQGPLLMASISDDGKGFDPAEIHQGIGLHTMRYRARAIGASLHVTARKGYGTIITLSGEVLSA